MSNATNPYYFRRRTIGRAASPPTWACYEQIPYDDDDDDCSDSEGSDSCSEDEEDYSRATNTDATIGQGHDSDDNANDHEEEIDNMDIDEDDEKEKEKKELSKDVKGKQRAIDPEPAPPQRQKRKRRQPVYALRPILTIQKSQGFVWNQDLFVPPYIKDRYVASTSPPNSRGFISTSASSTNSALTDYEVEVVEIRVTEGELSHIIP